MTSKLGFVLDESKKHPTFIYWHNGLIVAKTHISHGSARDVSAGVISAMARQVGVSGPQLRDALSCTLSGESFRRLLLGGSQSSSR
jgi:hypothetical protein